ncbi:MAG: 2Fe-2S iron-sulfur cluster binding domain-containing protein [Xanthomonadales bacterium]|nr:2Fe-2S iron-sulfur cluster binding domain-containing protein [Gammaproteobacteria bacterium]MBT8053290.1 2Fe-2S iron-sulfur cluster binding domain-containing protein [Gammaproteobacteria bacterium]NND58479.1 2Fe-2S iron-sulfur cluster binding domain-containing protein [Xanthomonadales bacterium]NNK50100.1 2Fe-2S iron-sulfur cluster binding domain-containing protein [Xanthomonadales bacterium]
MRIKVTDLDGRQHEIEAPPGEVLMETLREQDWGVAALCGGMCSCATCHVYIENGWLEKFPPKDSDEEELLEMMDYFQPNSRLSCQLRLEQGHDGLGIVLAPEE